jgi:HEAT repeat protein
VKALARRGDERTEDVLARATYDSAAALRAATEALLDPDPGVRAAAGVALASLRDPASVQELAEIVAAWDGPAFAACRRAALRALVAFRSEEAAVQLAHTLAMTRPERPLELEERSALLAVAYAEPSGVAARHVVRNLVGLLAHAHGPVAERAVALLVLFPAESHGPLVRSLRTAAAHEVRRRAAQALAACRQEAAVTALVSALEDPAPDVRAAAARSLGELRDPATLVALQTAGDDRDESVRAAAAAALRRLGTVASAGGMAAGVGALARSSHA